MERLPYIWHRIFPWAAPSNQNPDDEMNKGQSLVELAIVAPILILLLLGVFEVGWALRSYLVLANVNREATRFSARGIYLDFDKDDPAEVGYQYVVSHTLRTLSNQLPMDILNVNSNASMIVTYYEIEPNNFECPGGDDTCLNPDGFDGHPGFDCERFLYDNRDVPGGYYVAGENIANVRYPVLIPPLGMEGHADLPGFYGQVLTLTNTTPITAFSFHTGSALFSRINPGIKVQELRGQTNMLNCQLVQKGLQVAPNDVVVVENNFLQNQLVGLPIVTAFIANPMPMYSHTAMRIVAVRDQNKDDDESVCAPYPLSIPLSRVTGLQPGDLVPVAISGDPDVVPGNFNILNWNGGTLSTTELEDSFDSPELFVFAEPDTSPADDLLNVGDWVSAIEGIHADAQSTINSLANPNPGQGPLLLLPVWNDTGCTTSSCAHGEFSGSNGKFRVSTFTYLRLKETHLQTGTCPESGMGECLIFEYISPAPDACSCDRDLEDNCDPP